MQFVPLVLAMDSLSPQELYQSTKAKRAYKATHPECAMCGNLKYLEVHHVVPVHVDPARAADPTNLITLCDGPRGSNSACHRYFGHHGNFRSKWNPFIREQCVINRLILEKQDIYHDFVIPGEMMIMEFAQIAEMTGDEYIKTISESINRLCL